MQESDKVSEESSRLEKQTCGSLVPSLYDQEKCWWRKSSACGALERGPWPAPVAMPSSQQVRLWLFWAVSKVWMCLNVRLSFSGKSLKPPWKKKGEKKKKPKNISPCNTATPQWFPLFCPPFVHMVCCIFFTCAWRSYAVFSLTVRLSSFHYNCVQLMTN